MIRALIWTQIFLLVQSAVSLPSSSLWEIEIFRGPAPPPEEGPAFSANATRDPAKLKYELTGIGGAYIIWLLITCLIVLYLRRGLRRSQIRDQVQGRMDVEKSSSATAYGPRSPGKMMGVKSWANLSHRGSQQTVSSIDHQIVELDKIRNLDEMASLYAAVIAHDEKKSQSHKSVVSTTSEINPRKSSRSQPIGLPSSPRDIRPSQFYPLATPRSPEHPPYRSMQPLASPRSFQNPPPFYVEPTPLSPQYPSHWLEQQTPMTPHFPPELQHLREGGISTAAPPTPQIPIQHLNHGLYPADEDDTTRSGTSSRSSNGLLNPTSTPINNTGRNGSVGEHERTGSGGFHKPRPSQIAVHRQIPAPVHAYSEPQGFSPIAEEPGSATHQGGLPTPVPGRVANTSRNSELSQGSQQTTVVNTMSASNSTSTLPFRQYYSQGMTSAPATKTTFLDRKESSLKPPRTGVPQTPYSAYTPFTPMTPITPRRLVTKQEMKKKRKESSKRHEGDDNMVPSPQDMWGGD